MSLALLTACATAQKESSSVQPVSDFAGNLKTSAQLLIDAMAKQEFEVAVDLMYPGIVELAGGRASMVEMLQGLAEDFRKNNTTIKSIVLLDTYEPVAAGPELHAIVPYDQNLLVNGKEYAFTAYFLGISADQGQTWTFVDTTALVKNPDVIDQIFPHFNRDMQIPKMSEVVPVKPETVDKMAPQ